MVQKIFVQYNWSNIPQLNFAVETLATEPAAGKTGRIFRLSDGTLCYDDGTVIRKMVDLTQPVKSHTHAIADVTNLQSTLDGKAPTAHTHAIADVTNLQTTLDGKAAVAHTHADATTSASGFMSGADKTKLNGIASGAQVNTVTAVFGRTGAVVATAGDYNATQIAYTPAGTIAAVTVAAALAELDGDIGGKANASHTHAIADVTNLQATLDGKAPTSHTHTSSQISDFNASVDNRVVAYFDTVAGSDDDLDTLRELIDRIKQLQSSSGLGARGFTATIGDGSALSFDVTHNLATRNLIIQVFDTTDNYAEVVINKQMPSTNVVRIKSDGPAPATGSLFVVISAIG